MTAIRNILPSAVFSMLACATVMVSPGVAEFPVNTSGGEHETANVCLRSSKSGFVVVWRDKDGKSISAQRYDNPQEKE
ncbi:MAG: hypothetical protein HQ581_08865 [Planctomycetes bacterium]|nr:hypothetical protein [Planctomycetota bacterium]